MTNVRWVGLTLAALSAVLPAAGQSVVSTHSGVVYYFAGNVFIGDEKLEQKFGRFPDIDEGRDLRTEQGRAEVLLTPGVILRVAEHSSIRMLSNKLADTRVELLTGSAILESGNDGAKDTSVTLRYKQWEVVERPESVFQLDSEPAQMRVYRGEITVTKEGAKAGVTVKEGETLPLADVLVTEKTTAPETDSFKNWAMSRSQVITADNNVAAGIIDDPNQMDNNTGVAAGGFTYFPPTGIPSIGVTNPYGVSFWSPYQTMLTSIYFPTYFPSYLYGAGYGSRFGTHPGWPVNTTGPARTYPRPIGVGGWPVGAGLHPGSIPIRTFGSSPQPIMQHIPAPHIGVRAAPGIHAPAAAPGVHAPVAAPIHR